LAELANGYQYCIYLGIAQELINELTGANLKGVSIEYTVNIFRGAYLVWRVNINSTMQK